MENGANGESVVLEEEFDPEYEPNEDDIIEYAQYLGMHLENDKDLFWIAREGLKAPLPDAWKPCKTDDGEIYYFNFENGESDWEHPCDKFYKNLYQEEKKKKQQKIKSQLQQRQPPSAGPSEHSTTAKDTAKVEAPMQIPPLSRPKSSSGPGKLGPLKPLSINAASSPRNGPSSSAMHAEPLSANDRLVTSPMTGIEDSPARPVKAADDYGAEMQRLADRKARKEAIEAEQAAFLEREEAEKQEWLSRKREDLEKWKQKQKKSLAKDKEKFNTEISAAKEELDLLRRACEEYQSEKVQAQRSFDTIKEEVRHINTEQIKASARADAIRKEIKAEEAELQAAKDDIERRMSEMDEEQSRLEQRETDIMQKQIEQDVQQEQLEKRQAKANERVNEVQDLLQKLDQQKNDVQAQLREQEAEQRRVELRTEELKTEQQRLDDQLAHVKADIEVTKQVESSNADGNTKGAALAASERETALRKEYEAKLEAQRKEHVKELADLRSTLNELVTVAIAEQESECAAHEQTLSQQTERINDLEQLISSLQSHVSQQTRASSSSQHQVKELNRRLQQIQSDKQDTDDLLAHTQQRNEHLQNEVRNLRSQLSDLDRLQLSYESLERKYEAVTRENQRLEDLVSGDADVGLQQQVAALEKENKRYQQLVAKHQEDEKELRELRETVDGLKRDVGQKDAELDERDNTISRLESKLARQQDSSPSHPHSRSRSRPSSRHDGAASHAKEYRTRPVSGSEEHLTVEMLDRRGHSSSSSDDEADTDSDIMAEGMDSPLLSPDFHPELEIVHQMRAYLSQQRKLVRKLHRTIKTDQAEWRRSQDKVNDAIDDFMHQHRVKHSRAAREFKPELQKLRKTKRKIDRKVAALNKDILQLREVQRWVEDQEVLLQQRPSHPPQQSFQKQPMYNNFTGSNMTYASIPTTGSFAQTGGFSQNGAAVLRDSEVESKMHTLRNMVSRWTEERDQLRGALKSHRRSFDKFSRRVERAQAILQQGQTRNWGASSVGRGIPSSAQSFGASNRLQMPPRSMPHANGAVVGDDRDLVIRIQLDSPHKPRLMQ